MEVELILELRQKGRAVPLDVLAVLFLPERRIVAHEGIATFFEKMDRGFIVVLYFGDYRVSAVDCLRELLHCGEDIFGDPLPPILGHRDHYVDLGLVGLDPLREEQVHIANHPPIFGEHDKRVFGGVFQP